MPLPLQGVLEQYFLTPQGLLALLLLLPLVAIYLVRPKPEERVMPSMRFFREENDGGMIKSALERLRRNLILLFHILFLAGLAAAIANPYVNVQKTPENAVVVLDRSASMQGNLDEAKKFAVQNLGKKNTVIVVDDEVQVVEQDVSASAARKSIKQVDLEESETDIVSGIETARSYPGTVVVASDLGQSLSGASARERVKSLKDERPVKLMSTASENSWGIVSADIGKTVKADVKNFRQQQETLTASLGSETKKITVPGGSVRTVRFDAEPGKNVLKLEKDGFTPDNRLYVSLPEEKEYSVVLLSDSGNSYLEKATDLINFTSIRTVQPPVSNLPDADLYIVGYTDSILPRTASDLESKVRKGGNLVVFGQPGLPDKGFDFLPVTTLHGENTTDVEIEKPRRISVPGATVQRANATGDTWADPGEALVHSREGRGEILFYNVGDRTFNKRFLYPVFWKEVYSRMLERPTAGELNVKTGEEVAGLNYTEMKTTGFREAGNNVYAANLLSAEESRPRSSKPLNPGTKGVETEKSIRSHFSALLLLLALLEFLYLYRIGDLQW